MRSVQEPSTTAARVALRRLLEHYEHYRADAAKREPHEPRHARSRDAYPMLRRYLADVPDDDERLRRIAIICGGVDSIEPGPHTDAAAWWFRFHDPYEDPDEWFTAVAEAIVLDHIDTELEPPGW